MGICERGDVGPDGSVSVSVSVSVLILVLVMVLVVMVVAGLWRREEKGMRGLVVWYGGGEVGTGVVGTEDG